MKKPTEALVLAAALALAPGPARAWDSFKSVAKGVGSAASSAGVQRIAVLPFVSSNNQHPEDGIVMAERLIGALVRRGKVRVVERELLQGIMKEHYLTTSGVVSPENRRQLGKILAVDAIVTGSYVSFGRRAAVNARLIHVETGDILYAQTREIEVDWFDPYPVSNPLGALLGADESPLDCRQAQAQIERLERALMDLKTRFWMSQAASQK